MPQNKTKSYLTWRNELLASKWPQPPFRARDLRGLWAPWPGSCSLSSREFAQLLITSLRFPPNNDIYEVELDERIQIKSLQCCYRKRPRRQRGVGYKLYKACDTAIGTRGNIRREFPPQEKSWIAFKFMKWLLGFGDCDIIHDERTLHLKVLFCIWGVDRCNLFYVAIVGRRVGLHSFCW